MRTRSAALVLLAITAPLAGCEILDNTPPERPPAEIAAQYVGKPLLQLEMRWSEPWNLRAAGDGQAATWRFDQFNIAGCTLTVDTDATGIITNVVWTRGCGPKGTGAMAAPGSGLL
ncbi:MAG TPA: hypothetical protein VGR92_12250 [Steroidobacteraceae bacterium]|nr:hypothetical protein [Steroidobacteraceae bacterium]